LECARGWCLNSREQHLRVLLGRGAHPPGDLGQQLRGLVAAARALVGGLLQPLAALGLELQELVQRVRVLPAWHHGDGGDALG